LIYAKQAVSKAIVTVEGVAQGHAGGIHPFQRAMVKTGGVQCGFCTPGIIVSGCQYVDNGGSEDDASIQTALSGNLCRCTGYTKIIEAVKIAIRERRR
jgi:carbon-monoxide dehydrogenase small subunit